MDLSKVRIREHFGLVTNDTHTNQFSFLVSPPKGRAGVEKQDYVMLDHPFFGDACQVLGVIKEITSYEEVTGSSLSDKMGKMLALVDIVGFVDLRGYIRPLRKVVVPPNPGSRVYVPLTEFLEDTFSRNAQGKPFDEPINLGLWEATSAQETENTNIKCFLDAKDFKSTHTLIASVAGAGKTHTAKVIVQELGKTSTPIVIFDEYSEYSNDAAVNSQVAILSAKAEKTPKKPENEKIHTRILTEKAEKEILAKEIKKGKTTIINIHGLTPQEKRNFQNTILNALLKLRSNQEVDPFFLVIEEAENLTGETLDQIVAQGRKTGIALCLLSFHPTDLGGKILSQIGTHIMGRTVDKADIEYLSNMAYGMNGTLANLGIGEFVINGVNTQRPMKVQIRKL
jgi:DNA helicase HerA-like ATPase